MLAIGIPVEISGEVRYGLYAQVRPQRIGQALRRQAMPDGWVAAALDDDGLIVGRTREEMRYVGQHAVPSLAAAAAREREGTLRSETKEGIPVLTAFSRSSDGRWTVAVGAPVRPDGGPVALADLGRLRRAGHHRRRHLGGLPPGDPDRACRGGAGPAGDRAGTRRGHRRARKPPARPPCWAGPAARVPHAVPGPPAGVPRSPDLAEQPPALCELAARAGRGRAQRPARRAAGAGPGSLQGGERYPGTQLGRPGAEDRGGTHERRLRATDIVARFGGDEFVVLLDGADADTARDVARKLNQALAEPYPGILSSVTASIGIACFPRDGRHLLLAQADGALYAAKAAGRNRYEMASSSSATNPTQAPGRSGNPPPCHRPERGYRAPAADTGASSDARSATRP